MLLRINYDTKCIINDAIGPVKTNGIICDTKSIMQRSQLRAARALLSWSQERLAEAAGVSLPTIKRLEPGDGSLATRVETQEKLQAALETAGVIFVDENGDGPGVRLRKFKPKPTDGSVPGWVDDPDEADRKPR